MLDALYPQRAVIWGDLVAKAARHYALDLHRLHADTMAMTCAGLFADQPAVEGMPRLEPGDNPPDPFSFLTETIEIDQTPCYLAHTNDRVRDIEVANLKHACPRRSAVLRSRRVRPAARRRR